MHEGADSDLTFDTLANRLTGVRILLVPLVVGCMHFNTPLWNILAAIFFGIAGITDYFDGYYARSQKSVTIMGQLIDPLADKFLVVSSLIMLQDLGRIHPVVVILLICRELAITGLRAVASAEGVIIPASRLAKWKTTTQMAAIPMLMVDHALFGIPFLIPGKILTYASLLISLWSLKDYIVDFFKGITEGRRLKREHRRSEKRARRLAKKASRIRRLFTRSPELKAAAQEALDHPQEHSHEGPKGGTAGNSK